MQTTAFVNYHVKHSRRQSFQFDVGGQVGNLVSPELTRARVSVEDIRGSQRPVTFDADGVTFQHHRSAVADFTAPGTWQATYDAELTVLLQSTIGADDVIVFDHTVRIDDPSAARKPARNVHNDYTADSAKQRVIDLLGEDQAQEFEQGHYGFVNVWRPIEQPIETSPLGFIRPQSMNANDWMNIDLIYPDRVGQILGVAANRNHEWFYQSRMTPDEVAIFNIYDNAGRSHVGHSALDLEPPTDSLAIRKSIESRTLVRFN
ncbi:MAG: CmcJ/NvfI family oxidoreductase [Pseudomonadota bacterium]